MLQKCSFSLSLSPAKKRDIPKFAGSENKYTDGELFYASLWDSTLLIYVELKLTCGAGNPLTHMSDKDRLSPYNINTISTR